MSHPAATSFSVDAVDSGAGFDAFAAYLADHLGDNGVGGAWFQPMPAGAGLPPAREAAWRAGLDVPVGTQGWRRLWVAHDAQGAIAGHVDLRSHAHAGSAHRCLLGTGVARAHRRAGLGARLVAHAEAWARAAGTLEWIDLQVLAGNTPAVRLYERCGFQRLGETPDLFRIDGASLSSVTMARRL